MIIIPQTVKLNFPATSSSHGGDLTLNGNAGDVLEVAFNITGLSGGPSATTLTCKWQLAPKMMPGHDEDTVSATTARQWFDIVKETTPGTPSTATQWAKYFVDEEGNPVEDWPTDMLSGQPLVNGSNFNQAWCVRKIMLPSRMLVRAVMGNPVFTGGTSPKIYYAQHVTQYSNLG